MTAQQLKNAILQEAIKGRLVPQDPNDKPASILLERIRAEKERLVKEGKLKKKDLEVKPISEDEIPFEIPESWEWCRIKSVFSMQAGKNVTSADINSEPNDIYKYPCYGGNGLRGYVKRYNTEGVFPLVGRQGALCGNVNIASGQFWATEHAVVTDGYGITDVKWAYYFLIALNLNQYATATAQPGLAVSNIIEVLIPIPPLAEQKRIVAKIEELLPKVVKYGKAQEELNKLNEELPERLKKSILQEAIEGRLVPQDPNDEPASVLLEKIREEKKQLVKAGKLKKKDLEEKPISEDEIPFEIPESWEWVRMSQISLDSADGPFGSNLKRDHYTTNKEVRIIQLSNIGEEGWRDENVKYTTFEHLKNISRSEAFANDIIIAKMMPAGRAIICPSNDQKYVLSSDAVRFDFSDYLFRKYLYYAINSNVFKDQVYGEVQGITRVRTSLSKLRTYLLPLPPLAEQKRIVEKIEQLLKEIDKLK